VTGPVVTIRRGLLYLEKAIFEEHFAHAGVALLRDGDDLVVLPIAGVGGYLVKVRNLAGDRVVDAPDFFREHAIDDRTSTTRDAVWDDARSALLVSGVFR
jgi:hypothetical protein